MLTFQKTKKLENEIENYLHTIHNSTLLLREGIKEYMDGEIERSEKRVEEIRLIEFESETKSRDIKFSLYKFMLIPDARGDVMRLIDSLRKLSMKEKKMLQNLTNEKPSIPVDLKDDFLKLTHYSLKSVEYSIRASRSYFMDLFQTHDLINKVYFYENEADKVEEKIKKAIFGKDREERLSERMHLRYFTERIAFLSDSAERVCEMLSVFVIKRSI